MRSIIHFLARILKSTAVVAAPVAAIAAAAAITIELIVVTVVAGTALAVEVIWSPKKYLQPTAPQNALQLMVNSVIDLYRLKC